MQINFNFFKFHLSPVEGIATIINATFPQSKLTARKLKLSYHPDYDYNTHANNIAIIELDTVILSDTSESFQIIKNLNW